MGHKPDQKARRKRREREAKRNIPPPKKRKPPFTAKEPLDTKRALIAKNRSDLKAKIASAPLGLHIAYWRCFGAIARLVRLKPRKAIAVTLYPDACKDLIRLSDTGIVRLRDLLTHPASGWDVRLSAPLPPGKPLSLVFHFDPHED